MAAVDSDHPGRDRRIVSGMGVLERAGIGGQAFNVGSLDLNLVAAHFLEKDRGDTAVIGNLIEQTVRNRGWLVIATHDIADEHTPYGCTPAFFESVVRDAARSGALVMPVAAALKHVLRV